MFDNKAIDSVDKYKILVQGRFLNFSKTHPVLGIDLIEDLLFWTDNRNQPRKINVTKAIADSTYYTTEDQISVAKFYPHKAIRLWKSHNVGTITRVSGAGTTAVTYSLTDASKLLLGMTILYGASEFRTHITSIDTSVTPNTIVLSDDVGSSKSNATFYETLCQNASEKWLPASSTCRVDAVSLGTSPSSSAYVTYQLTGEVPEVGWRMTCPGKVPTDREVLVTNVQYNGSNPASGVPIAQISISLYTSDFPLFPVQGDIVKFHRHNPTYRNNWPGDASYLEDKFVRFSYRFKFDDGEYSLIAPFTQPAFIPKQKGYYNDGPISGNLNEYEQAENRAGGSTIVDFFENDVNNIYLQIDTPFIVSELKNRLKVSEIDILYKESDGLAIRVIDTISTDDYYISSNNTSLISYNYQSRKPFKTLPEKETTRVFDKVPIRALSQSVVGSRVIYGNFIDKHTPPESLDYNIAITSKYQMNPVGSSKCNIAYPNHTVKQNRTYQVGIVLADRYGRQSDVILSSLDDSTYSLDPSDPNSQVYVGSTAFNPYNNNNINARNFLGQSIKLAIRSAIPETVSYADGYPGLYKSGEYTATVTPAVSSSTTVNLQSGTLDPNVAIGNIITGPATGGGTFTTSIKSVNHATSTITVVDSISIDDVTTVTMHGPENKLGWYTYKVVVKQTEQDYYNIYLPNISTADITTELFSTGNRQSQFLYAGNFYTTLISDNINKMPADLEEVQPEQSQFRTSDDLFYPRVGWREDVTNPAPQPDANKQFSSQFYQGTNYLVANSIAKLNDMGLATIAGKGNVNASLISASGGGVIAAVAPLPSWAVGTQKVVNNVNVTGGSGSGLVVDIIFTKTGTSAYDIELRAVVSGSDYVSGNTVTIPADESGQYTYKDVTWDAPISATLAATNFYEEGQKKQPLNSPGIYNDSSNPMTAQLSSYNGLFKIGGEPQNNMVFSCIERKPENSRLEIYWETSTSGLISELNTLVNTGGTLQPIPEDPVVE